MSESIHYVDTDYAVGNAGRVTSFGKEDVDRLREGKLLKDRSSNRVKSKIQNSQEITGSTSYQVVTFTAGDSTPDVSGGTVFKTANLVRSPADIGRLDGGTAGQTITIIIQDASTDFSHGSRLNLSGGVDWTTCTTGDTISFVCIDGVTWYETNRSDNT
jgi:hypothetical protein